MNIVLHIDRVVMRDMPISRAQLPLLRAALEAELRNQFSGADGRELAKRGSSERASAKPFTFRADESPARIGRHAARAVRAATQARGRP